MKILFDTNGIFCVTPCPHGRKTEDGRIIKVGTYDCLNCLYFSMQLGRNKIVCDKELKKKSMNTTWLRSIIKGKNKDVKVAVVDAGEIKIMNVVAVEDETDSEIILALDDKVVSNN